MNSGLSKGIKSNTNITNAKKRERRRMKHKRKISKYDKRNSSMILNKKEIIGSESMVKHRVEHEKLKLFRSSSSTTYLL